MTAPPSKQRLLLNKLAQGAGEYITIDTAAQILNISTKPASRILIELCRRGWLNRVARGLYVLPSLATPIKGALSDPYAIVPLVFAPAYIGGWSAAMHWHLTEQIFHDICVITAKKIRKNRQTIYNIPFIITHVPLSKHTGIIPIWRNEHKVPFSDPSKTIIDMLALPKLGGGMSHIKECFENYTKSEYFSADLLLKYAVSLDNGAVFKRLGYLSEQILGAEHILVKTCAQSLTKGKIQYDPMVRSTKLATRWQMFVPDNLT